MLLLTVVAAMGAHGARLSFGAGRTAPAAVRRAPGWSRRCSGPRSRRRAAQGAADRDVRRSRRARADRGRSLRPLAAGAQAACRHRLVCRCWCCPGSSPSSARAGDAFFAESVGQDLLQQDVSAARSPTARRPDTISCCSGSRSGRARRWRPWRHRRSGRRGASRATKFLLAWLRAVLDRVRAGGDQAAALRAAALSRDRDPDRRRGRRAAAVAQTAAGARHDLVVRGSDARRASAASSRSS